MMQKSALTEFCAALDIGPLLPAEYSPYQQPILDALSYFIKGLPANRIDEILQDQNIANGVSAISCYVALAARCPTLQKLGQILARDRRLSIEVRLLLQGLESMVPKRSSQDLEQHIQNELGPLSEINVELAKEPTAEGSVAIVIPFLWTNRSACAVEQGVFKILKPGIEERLSQELELLERVGAFLDERCDDYCMPEIDYKGTFAQVRDLLGSEIRLEQEQRHLVSARKAYATNSAIVVPGLFPFSTSRLTAMERVFGHKVTDVSTTTAGQRRHLASLMVEALIANPVWSDDTLFHGDPHAGNLFRLSDNRTVAILDWSLAGQLNKSEQIGLSQILIGAITLNSRLIHQSVSDLSTSRVNHASLQSVIKETFRELRGGTVPGLNWLVHFMDQAVSRANVSFSSDLLLFRKVLHTLEGVIAGVDAQCDVDRIMILAFLRRLLTEWPARIAAPVFSRRFNTHLSNADITSLCLSLPMSSARFWYGCWADLLAPSASSD